MSWRLALMSSCVAIAVTAAPAAAQVQADGVVDTEADTDPSASTSVGVPDRGRLLEPAELELTPYIYLRENRRRGRSGFGTAELVSLIQRAAAAVGVAHPGPRLVVGDLSRRRGGRFGPHRSHQSGRDADLGFYLLDESGDSVQAEQFVSLRRSGCGSVRVERFCLDGPRNWALLASLVSDPSARVQYVLIAPDIRRRVLEAGEASGADPDLIARVRTVTEPHSGSASHRSHFHVRIYCPVDDRPRCIDEAPFHDWYEGTPASPSPGIRRMRARQRRARARQRARRQARIRRRDAARRQRRRRAARARQVRRRAAAERQARRRRRGAASPAR